MTNGPGSDVWLDSLLAQPPQMSDDGFVSRVKSQIERREKQRTWIFAGMASLWLVILLLFFPRGFVADNLQQVITLRNRIDELVQTILGLDLSILLTQSTSLSSVVIILLGVCALISMQLNNR